MLFNFANLPYWIFLGTGVSLFLLVIVSGGGDDDLDLDADADVEVDISNGPLDLDTDAEGDFSAVQILGWLGLGKAPLILLLATDLSLWGLLGWMLNVAAAGSLGRIPGVFWGSIILVSSLAIALFLGSLVARPIGKALAAFGEDASSDRLIGCEGWVSSALIPAQHLGKIGQVDVIDRARNRVTVNAALPDWATVLPRRGESVVVIDRQAQHYLVIAKDSTDEARWLSNPPHIQNSR